MRAGLLVRVTVPAVVAATLGLAAVAPAHAAPVCTASFIGADGGNWYTASNWNPSSVPTSADRVCLADHSVVVKRGGGDPSSVAVDSVTTGTITIANGELDIVGANDPSNITSLSVGDASAQSPVLNVESMTNPLSISGDYTQTAGQNNSTGEIDVGGNFSWTTTVPNSMNPASAGLIKQTASNKTFSISGAGQQLLYGMTVETFSPATISNSADDFSVCSGGHLIAHGSLTLAATVVNLHNGCGTDAGITVGGDLVTSGTAGILGCLTTLNGDVTGIGGDVRIAHLNQAASVSLNVPDGDTLTVGDGTAAGAITGPGRLKAAGGTLVSTGTLSVTTLAIGEVGVSSGNITVNGDYAVTGSTSIHSGTLTQNSGSASTGDLIVDGGSYAGSGTLTVNGDIHWSAGQLVTDPGATIVQPANDKTFVIDGTGQQPLYDLQVSTNSPVTLSAADLITANGAALTTTSTIDLSSGAAVQPNGGNNATFTAASLVLPSAGGLTYGFGPDSLVLTGGPTIVSDGTLTAGDVTVTGFGVLVDDALVDPSVTVTNGALLSGNGDINGSLTNTGGFVEPGNNGAGTLAVSGSYSQDGSGQLTADVGGPSAFGVLGVNGSATFAPGAVVHVQDTSYRTLPTDTFDVLHASSITGTPAVTDGTQWTGSVVNGGTTFEVSPLCGPTNDAGPCATGRETVTGSVSPAGTGSVTASATSGNPACAGATCTVDSGTDVTLTATPKSGYTFTGWSGDCSGTTNPCVITNVKSDKAATAHFADKTKPIAHVLTPAATKPFTLASLAVVTWSATDQGSGVASYTLQYVVAKWNGGFGAPVRPAGLNNTTKTRTTISLTPGYDYCFQVRARDHAGNVGAWSAKRCVARPLDDRALSGTGWSKLTGSKYYLHTAKQTKRKGVVLLLRNAAVRRIAIVFTGCTTCGGVDVLVNGHRYATVSCSRSSTRNQVVVVLKAFSLRAGATIKLRTTRGNRPVVIDGLGISRT